MDGESESGSSSDSSEIGDPTEYSVYWDLEDFFGSTPVGDMEESTVMTPQVAPEVPKQGTDGTGPSLVQAKLLQEAEGGDEDSLGSRD
ncbi:Hypothetical predicted protein, partial [Scomber scombrus]